MLPSGKPVSAQNVFAQYEAFTNGRAYNDSLPRDPPEFLAAAFGPLSPIRPIPIDNPPEGQDRAGPRQWQYPVGWNMPVGVPGTEGLKLATFAQLRAFADLFSIVRACISVRKAEILGLDWDIMPTDEAARAMRGKVALQKDFADRRKQAIAFFRAPDRNFHTYHSWMNALLEDVMVVDALSIYLHPARQQGKGLLGSNLAQLSIVDGTTIRPLVDTMGSRPAPPNPAFQQYIWGVPRSEYMQVLQDSDEIESPAADAEYRADQLLYLPYERRAWTPYGFPGIERAIIPVITGLLRQQYWLNYYQEGSIPGMFVTAPPDASSPAQVRLFQDTLNSVAGDPAYKHKIIVLPHGATSTALRPAQLSDVFDNTLTEQVLMAYDVMPMELGLMPPGLGLGMASKQMAEQSAQTMTRKATMPLLKFLKSTVFDYILQHVCGMQDMEWLPDGMKQTGDAAEESAMLIAQAHAGLITIDEARLDLSLEPFGLPATSDPQYFIPTGLVPLAKDPMEEPEPPPAPIMLAPGHEPPKPGEEPNSPEKPDSSEPSKPDSPPKPGNSSNNSNGSPLHQASGNAGDQPDEIDAKVATKLRELDSFGAYIRHKRDPAKFVGKALAPDELARIVADIPEQGAGLAIAEARKRVTDDGQKAKRDAILAAIAMLVAAGLGKLAKKLAAGTLSMYDFIAAANAVMQDGTTRAYSAGTDTAMADLANAGIVGDGTGYSLSQTDLENIASRVTKQHGFLTGMAQDIVGGVGMGMIGARLDLYGQSTRPTFEEGYMSAAATTVAKAGGTVKITWRLGDSAEPCVNCVARDGQTFTEETLPGYPGDGSFGGELCLGGPQCACSLQYSYGGATAASDAQ